MSTPWRLIPLCEGSGPENMAVDSWLLDQCAKGLQPSTLRFYTWQKPTLSLGYHQKQFPAHWNNLRYQGESIELVRRPTGGRAVLHQGDLTYALITSGLKGSRRETYRQLSQFLIEGWRTLGIELTFGGAGSYIKNPNCFGSATSADLVMENGYKLIGSAQVYRDSCVLQHGSIRLRPDPALFYQVFGDALETPQLPESCLSEDGVGNVMEALTTAASRCFDASFQPCPLSSSEQTEISTDYKTRFEPLSV